MAIQEDESTHHTQPVANGNSGGPQGVVVDFDASQRNLNGSQRSLNGSQKSLGPRSKKDLSNVSTQTAQSNTSSNRSLGRRANASRTSLDGISERSANGSRRSMTSSRRKPKRQVSTLFSFEVALRSLV